MSLFEFDTKAMGIPCTIKVIDIDGHEAEGKRANNDIDAKGWVDVDFVVCDRRGRPAPWISRKLDESEIERIELEAVKEAKEHFSEY